LNRRDASAEQVEFFRSQRPVVDWSQVDFRLVVHPKTLAESAPKGKPMAALGPIRYVTVHCSATPEGRDVKAATISEWDKAKFGQISYHWVIELDGTAVRTLPDTTKGAHVGKANSNNIGICYVGGVDKAGNPKDTRTTEQKKALATLIRTYQSRVPNLIVLGHRNWPKVAKACPSFDCPGWVKAGMPV
jgi:N-acetylmuramoyl-L-alanine amidase